MGKISKTYALFLTLIIALPCLNLLTVNPADAQSTPIPSVPQFTLQLVGPPFTQNTTYSLNSDTGQIEPNIGYTNNYTYLVITIKNQQYDSKYGSIFYNITVNGSPFSWEDNQKPQQTEGSDTTKISLNIFGQWGLPSIVGQQVTIRVQAMLGTDQWGRTTAFDSQGYYFYGTTGDLSDPQTILVPANVPLSPPPSTEANHSASPTSTSYSLTPTPTSPASSYPSISFLLITNTISLIVIAVLLAVIIALLLMRRRKTSNLTQ